MPFVKLFSRNVPRTLVTDLARVGESIHLGTFQWTDASAQQELQDLASVAFGVLSRAG